MCVPGFRFQLRPAFPGWDVWVCVFVCAICLYPANAGWGSWCVCLCSGFCFHPANPRWGLGVCVGVCNVCLHPNSPGWGVRCGCVCLGAGFGCAPLYIAGCWGVGVCVHAPYSPPILAGVCGVCMSAQALAFTPAILAGVLRRVYLCGHSTCTLPFLARVLGVSAFAWVQFPAASSASWLGVFGCVCLCACSACTPPILAGVLGRVCLCAHAACTPPFLAQLYGVCVCVLGFVFWVRAAIPGLAVWVCVFACALCLYPSNPGGGLWCVCVGVQGLAFTPPILAGVLESVCLRARYACTLPFLPGLCAVHVCAWVRVSAAPRQSWSGCLPVCVCVHALPVPRQYILAEVRGACVSVPVRAFTPPILA